MKCLSLFLNDFQGLIESYFYHMFIYDIVKFYKKSYT
jgi:hypothetical protein